MNGNVLTYGMGKETSEKVKAAYLKHNNEYDPGRDFVELKKI